MEDSSVIKELLAKYGQLSIKTVPCEGRVAWNHGVLKSIDDQNRCTIVPKGHKKEEVVDLKCIRLWRKGLKMNGIEISYNNKPSSEEVMKYEPKEYVIFKIANFLEEGMGSEVGVPTIVYSHNIGPKYCYRTYDEIHLPSISKYDLRRARQACTMMSNSRKRLHYYAKFSEHPKNIDEAYKLIGNNPDFKKGIYAGETVKPVESKVEAEPKAEAVHSKLDPITVIAATMDNTILDKVKNNVKTLIELFNDEQKVYMESEMKMLESKKRLLELELMIKIEMFSIK